MRNYEKVFIVHPDQSFQVPEMIELYNAIVKWDGSVQVSDFLFLQNSDLHRFSWKVLDIILRFTLKRHEY